jgi:hypothetical protein
VTGTVADGTWNLTIHTPIGKQRAILVLSRAGGVLRGVARDVQSGEETALNDLVLDGDRLRWTQSITKPMWLNLTFDVTVAGDEMTGHSKAGRLPKSRVVGRRMEPDSTGHVPDAGRGGPDVAAGATTVPAPDRPVVAVAAQNPAGHRVGDALPAEVAGIRIPRTSLIHDAVAFSRSTMPEVLFNHVLRTYLFGAIQLRQAGTGYDEELAFLGCLLHDLGLLRPYWTPEERFEVDGADAARDFLAGRGMGADKTETVWDAIALHTIFGIAVRKRPEISIVCLGSVLDLAGVGYDTLPDGAVDAVIAAFPRLGFKQAALDTMVSICTDKPAGVIMHQFAEVGRSRVPGFAIPTLEEILFSAPFDD